MILPVKVGDKLKFKSEKQRYTVTAVGRRYCIAVKPMNALKTYLYTIVDFESGMRGPDNLVFGPMFEYKDPKEAAEAIKLLEADTDLEISHRRSRRLELERVDNDKRAKKSNKR